MCDKKTGLIYIKTLFSLTLMVMAGFDIIYIIAPQGKKMYLKYFISYNIILMGPINILVLIVSVWIINELKRLCVINLLCLPVNLSVFIYLILNYPKLNILDWHDHPKWTYSSGVIAWSDIKWILLLFGIGFIPFAIVIFYIWNRHELRERGYLD
nr:uncharacterized protein LOC118877450 [Drosophila suzukii]